MIVTKLWFVAWFLDFYDKNAILLKEAGSTRFQNLQDRFGNILRIAPLLMGLGLISIWIFRSDPADKKSYSLLINMIISGHSEFTCWRIERKNKQLHL